MLVNLKVILCVVYMKSHPYRVTGGVKVRTKSHEKNIELLERLLQSEKEKVETLKVRNSL